MNFVSYKIIFVSFFAFIQFSVPSLAQEVDELNVVGKEIKMATGEIIRSSDSNRDNNGLLAAGLLIYSDLPNLSFESNNGVLKSNKNPGSWLLYLSPNERVVTVYGTGFVPKRIILSEYGVDLESGKVWELTITGDKKEDDVPVVIRTSPPTAEVFINGDKTDFSRSIPLKPGEYSVEILQEGYEPFSETINISPQNTFFEYELVKLEPQLVNITTNPVGSVVKIDGMEEGETDSEGKLSVFKFPGQYSIEVNASGYVSEEKTVDVLNKEANNYSFELEKNTGSVQFSVSPSNAQMLINKRAYTINETVDLAPGLYQIEIKKERYKPETFEIMINRGDAIFVEKILEPYQGNVFFTASPSYATVELYDESNNRVESWEGTKKLEDLSYGNYRYEIEADTYTPQNGTIEVNSENVSVNISLEKDERILSSNDEPELPGTPESNTESNQFNSLRLVGNPSFSSGDIIADRDDNRDINGRLTAGLRIETDLTGLQFRSNNGIHKAQQLPGATLLYLSEIERVVTVYKDGYPPFQIILSDEGIDLESGRIWEIQLTGNQRFTTEPVQFTVNPGYSTIFIDGEEFKIDGTVLNTELATGDHFIQIRKDRHEIREESITISSSVVNTFNYTLEEINPIPVLINSTPQGASIYLNDSPGSVGETPKQVFVYPGELKIRLTLPGHSNVEDELLFTGETDELSYNLQEFIGLLSVNVDPPNATVIIDNEVQASRKDIRLVPGPHRLEIRATGYEPYNFTIDIAQGDSLVEDVSLSRITGNLFFIAQQPDMQVTLAKDGRILEKWEGVKTLRNLPVGTYLITAKLQNFQTRTQEFELLRNEDEVIDFDLSPTN